MREIFNPFKVTPKAEKATASYLKADTSEKGEQAVASALSNVDPSMCPKCGAKMGTAFLYDRRSVYYCDTCRVSHPTA